ncbi:peroxiredoxin, partial [Vibrio vulnificus]
MPTLTNLKEIKIMINTTIKPFSATAYKDGKFVDITEQ